MSHQNLYICNTNNLGTIVHGYVLYRKREMIQTGRRCEHMIRLINGLHVRVIHDTIQIQSRSIILNKLSANDIFVREVINPSFHVLDFVWSEILELVKRLVDRR